MIPPSIFPDATMLDGAAFVLSRIERLAPDAAGVLRFGQAGMVLVQGRSVCWAVAAGMEQRLTDLLRHQRNPPLDRRFLEGLLEGCRTSGTPIGEALLASGEITEAGLRSALFRQAVEAIAHIARAKSEPPDFIPHASASYDARFSFGTAEIFAAIGARRDRALAAVSRRHLDAVLGPDTAAIAFTRQESGAPEIMTVVNAGSLHVELLCEACAWSTGLFDVVATVEPETFLATGAWRASAEESCIASVVVWRAQGLYFTALCTSRAAAAVLASRIAGHQRAGDLA